MQNNRAVGSLYEEKAAEYLKSLGYRIIERNFHAGKTGEIDIIAIDCDTYVFIECKFRKDIASGDPFEAVGKTKIRNICICALVYMKYKHISMDNKIRFDVIAMYGNGKLNHVKNAFEFINPYEK